MNTFRTVFVDLDGVLADFDGGYEKLFGVRPDKRNEKKTPDLWTNIETTRDFFYNLQLMPDALDLWHGVRALVEPNDPVVLTGIPLLNDADKQKKRWVYNYLGYAAAERMICCRSVDKCKFGRIGDILIDDWEKYRHLWVGMGGVFVLHTGAVESLKELKEVL